MQIGDLFGIVVASLVLFFPIAILDRAYHFGSPSLPAPQAGIDGHRCRKELWAAIWPGRS